jgi:bacterioferritin-associated ferredoxin
VGVYICQCWAVTDHEVLDVVERGAHTVEAIGHACGAGTDCGTCREELADLLDCAGVKALAELVGATPRH